MMKVYIRTLLLIPLLVLIGTVMSFPRDSVERQSLCTRDTQLFVDSSIKNAEQLTPEIVEGEYHVFSHGKPGELLINGKWLNRVSLSNFLKERIPVGTHSIFIYGCNFAASVDGQAAVRFLEDVLGVRIFASTNITGAGGDWVLEYGHSRHSYTPMNYPYSFQCTPSFIFSRDAGKVYVEKYSYGSVDESLALSHATNFGTTTNSAGYLTGASEVDSPPIGSTVIRTISGLIVGLHHTQDYKEKMIVESYLDLKGIRCLENLSATASVCIRIGTNHGTNYTYVDANGSNSSISDDQLISASSPASTLAFSSRVCSTKPTIYARSYFLDESLGGNFYFEYSIDNGTTWSGRSKMNGFVLPTADAKRSACSPDIDLDGHPSLCDQDDDNDGILDSAEGPFNPLGDADLDGIIDALDFTCTPYTEIEEIGLDPNALGIADNISPVGTYTNVGGNAGLNIGISYEDFASNNPNGKLGSSGLFVQDIAIPVNNPAVDNAWTATPNNEWYSKYTFSFTSLTSNLKIISATMTSDALASVDLPSRKQQDSYTITSSGGTLTFDDVSPICEGTASDYIPSGGGTSTFIATAARQANGTNVTCGFGVEATGSDIQDFTVEYQPIKLLRSSAQTVTIATAHFTLNLLFSNTVTPSCPYLTGYDMTDSNQDGLPNVFDFDNDGILNGFDTDSDNDGCWDAIEGGQNVLLRSLESGMIKGAVSSTGIPNLIGSGQSVGTSMDAVAGKDECTDFDNDGVQDVVDIDNDNDGVVDTNEGAITDDFDKDGVPNYHDNDSDNDGCPDAVEAGGSITVAQVGSLGRISGDVSNVGVPTAVGSGQPSAPDQLDSLKNYACCPGDIPTVADTLISYCEPGEAIIKVQLSQEVEISKNTLNTPLTIFSRRINNSASLGALGLEAGTNNGVYYDRRDFVAIFNGELLFQDTQGLVCIKTKPVDISSYAFAAMRVDLRRASGDMDAADFILAKFYIDDNLVKTVQKNGNISTNYGTYGSGLFSGSTARIEVCARTGPDEFERYAADNFTIIGLPSLPTIKYYESDPTVSSVSPVATGLDYPVPMAPAPSTKQIWVTSTNADGCESAPRKVTINSFPGVLPMEGSTLELCYDSPITNLNSQVISNFTLGGTWTDIDGSGVNISDPTKVNFQGVAEGGYFFEYTVSPTNSLCSSEKATVLISYNDPKAPGVKDTLIEYCEPGSAVIQADEVGPVELSLLTLDKNITIFSKGVNNSSLLPAESLSVTKNTGTYLDPNDFVAMRSGELQFRDSNGGEVCIKSSPVSVLGYDFAVLSLDVRRSGGSMEPPDYIKVNFYMDGNLVKTVTKNGNISQAFQRVSSGYIPVGSVAEIEVCSKTGLHEYEKYSADNFRVLGIDNPLPTISYYTSNPNLDTTATPVATGTTYDVPMPTAPATEDIWVTLTRNGCESPPTKVRIKSYPGVSPMEGNILSYCGNPLTLNLVSNIVDGYVSGGTWTSNTGLTITSSNANSLNVSTLAKGTYDFTYRITSTNPVCGAETAEILISIGDLLPPDLDDTLIEYCEPGSPTIVAKTSGEVELDLKTLNSSFTVFSKNVNNTAPLVAEGLNVTKNTGVYYDSNDFVAQTGGELKFRDLNDGEVCIRSSPVSILGYDYASLSLDVRRSGGSMESSDYIKVNFYINGSLKKTVTKNGNIGSSLQRVRSGLLTGGTSAEIEVCAKTGLHEYEVYGADNFRVAGINAPPTINYYTSNPALDTTATPVATGTSYDVPMPAAPATKEIWVTTTRDSCESVPVKARIISHAGIPPMEGNILALCGTSNNLNLVSNIINGYASGGTWTSSTGLTITDANASNLNISSLAKGQYTFTYTRNSQNPVCGSETAEIMISIGELPPPELDTLIEYCEPGSPTIFVKTSGEIELDTKTLNSSFTIFSKNVNNTAPLVAEGLSVTKNTGVYFDSNDFVAQTGGELKFRDLNDGEVCIRSSPVNILGYDYALLSLDVRRAGGSMENTDFIKVNFYIDGSLKSTVTKNGNISSSFQRVRSGLLTGGTSAEIEVCAKTGLHEYEVYGADNFRVAGINAPPTINYYTSNPVLDTTATPVATGTSYDVPMPAAPATKEIWVTVRKDTCVSPPVKVRIISHVGLPPMEGTILNYCTNPDSLNLVSNIIDGYAPGGTWTSNTGLTITSSNASNLNISTLGKGEYTFTYTRISTDSVCSAETAEILLMIGETASPTNISATKPRICMGDSTVLSATCTQGTVAWYSDASLTVVLPSSTVKPTQTRYYYVSCGASQCGTFKDSIRIEVLPSGVAPTNIMATKPRICTGDSTVLSATCTQGTVTWYNDASLTVVLPSSTVKPTQTRYYYVNCGASQCGATFKDSIRIEVVPSSVAPTNISATKPRICTGDSTVLSATCTQGTVTWYNDASMTVVLPSSTVKPTQTRYYYVNCGTIQCGGTFKDSIRIEVLPSGVAPTNIMATKPRICTGDSTVLSATCTQGTVTWYNDASMTVVLPSSTVKPTQTRYYYVNCGGTQCGGMLKDSIRIEVLPSGVAPTSISATKPRICMGDSTVLSATCTQGTVTWYNDASLTVVLPSSTVKPTQTRYYYVNCGASQCGGMFKDSIRIEVLPSGVAPTSISATKPRICTGDSTVLSATCTQGTVTWYNDASMTVVLPSSTVKPTQTRYYYVNCGASQCGGMLKDSIRIEVLPSGVAPTSISATKPRICMGDSTVLSATCTQGTVTWYNDASMTVVLPSSTVKPTQTRYYYVNCGGTQCGGMLKDSIRIEVLPSGVAPTSISATKPRICMGDSTVLSATCTQGTVTWYNDASMTVVLPSSTVKPTQTRYYYVNCGATQCGGMFKDSIRIEVLPSGVAPTSISATKPRICMGDSTVLSATCTQGTVTWYNDASLTVVLPSSTVKPTQTRYYYVNCGASQCGGMLKDSIRIEVLPSGVAPTSISATKPRICMGDSTVLSATCTQGTVSWYNDASMTVVLPSSTVKPTQTRYYYVNCGATQCGGMLKDSIRIEVLPSGVAPTSISATKPRICMGDSTVLSATCTQGTVTWYNDASMTVVLPSSTVKPTQTRYYYVNCGGTQCGGMLKDSIRIEVLPSGVAPTSISATKPRICMGDSTVLSATCTQGTVTWYNDASMTVVLPSSTVKPTQTRYYYVNCGGTQCGGMLKDSIRIEVLPSGVAPTSISATKPRICMGDSTVLSATCTQGTVTWYNDASMTVVLPSSTVKPTQTRYYYVNCGASQCGGMLKDSIRIEVLPSGVAPTSISATKPRICMGDSTVLSATCTQGTVTWYNDASMTVVLPSSTVKPTQTRYYYVNCGGTQCGGMLKDSIRIEVLPSGVAPTSISATKPRICMGDSTVLSATCTQGTVTWYNDASMTVVLPSSTVKPTQTRYYYVNCGTTQCGMFKDSIRIEVLPSGVAPTSISATKPRICMGDSTVLSATCTQGTVSWYNDASMTVVLPSSTVKPTQTRYYYVNCGGTQCGGMLKDSIRIEVLPSGVAPTSISATKPRICMGDSTVLSATCTQGTVSWYNDASMTVVLPSSTVKPTQTRYYYVNCGATQCGGMLKDSIRIEVLPSGVAPTSISATKPRICMGDSTVLSATCTQGTVTWYNDASMTVVLPSSTVKPTQTRYYYVNCGGTQCGGMLKDSIRIEVLPSGVAPTSISATKPRICMGDSTVLSATCTQGTVTWYNDASMTVVLPSSTVKPTQTRYYYVNCGASQCGGMLKDSIRIEVLPSGVAPTSISATKPRICMGDSTVLSATCTQGTVTWYNDASMTVVLPSSTVKPTQTRYYYVNCGGTQCGGMLKDSIRIEVLPSGVAPTSISATKPRICMGDSTVLSATCTQGTVTWYNDSGLTTSLASSTVSPTQTRYYYVNCGTTQCGMFKDSIRIEVLSSGVAPTSISATKPRICMGESTVLSATCTQGTVSWYNDSGLTTSLASSTVSPTQTRYYYVNCGTTQCGMFKDSIRIEVLSSGVAPTSISATKPRICMGESTVLSATCTQGTVSWYNDSGLTTSLASSTVSPTQTRYYYVNCGTTQCGMFKDSIRIEVLSSGVAPTSISATKPRICMGESTVLSATCTQGTVSWYNDSGLTTSLASSTVSPTQTRYYYVNCGTTQCGMFKDSIRIEVLSSGVAPTSISATKPRICMGESTVLSATCTQGTVSWYNDSGLTTSLASSTVSPTQTRYYYVNCGTTQCGMFKDSIRIEVLSSGVAPTSISATKPRICMGESTVLSATCTQGTVSWYNDSGLTTSLASSTVSPTQTRYYYVNCGTTQCGMFKDSIRIEVLSSGVAPTSISATKPRICMGESTVLSATCTQGTVSWYNDSGLTTSLASSTVSPTQTRYYYVNCGTTQCGMFKDSIRIEVLSSGVAPTSISATKPRICMGESTVLSATCTQGTVSWYNDSGLTTSLASSTVSPTQTRYYYVNCGTTQCGMFKDSIRIEVLSSGVAPTSISATKPRICMGESTVLSATCTQGTVSWYNDSGLTTSLASSTVSPTQTRYYYVNCGTTQCGMFKDSIRIEVLSSGVAPTSISATKPRICMGESTVLSATCTQGTVSWYNDSGLTTSLASSTVSPTQTRYYYVNCGTTQCGMFKDSIRIEVLSSGVAPTSISATKPRICMGESTVLSATCTQGTVSWYNDSGLTTSLASSTVSPTQTRYYYVNCGTTQCGMFKDSIRIEVLSSGVAPTSISATKPRICMGESTVLSATCTQGTVSWYNDSGLTTSLASSTVSPTQTRYYYVNCGTTQCGMFKDSIRIEVLSSGVAPTSISATKPRICMGESTVLSATCTQGTVSWYNDSGLTTSLASSTVSPTQTRYYYVNCGTTQCGMFKDSIRIEVLSSGVAPTSISATKPRICMGESTVLSATCTQGTVSWYNDSGLTTSLASSTVSPTQTRYYYVNCGTTQCGMFKDSIRIEVLSSGVAPTSISATKPRICMGESTVLSATCTQGTVSWYNDSGLTTSLASSTVSPTQTRYYYVNCGTTQCGMFKDSIRIEVLSSGVAPTSISATKPRICMGESTVLSATCTQGTVSWYNDSGLTTSLASSTVSPTQTRYYYVNCGTTQCGMFKDSIRIEVLSSGVAPTSISATKPRICMGESTVLSATCTQGTVSWYNDSGLTTSLASSTVSPTQTRYYYVNCGTTQCGMFKDSIRIEVLSSGVAPTSISATKPRICMGESTVLSATCTQGTVSWYNDSGLTTSLASSTVSPTQTRYYYVNCGTTQCGMFKDSIRIEVLSSGVAPTSISATKPRICMGESTVLSATCTQGTVSWYNDSGLTTSLASSTVSPTQTRYYYVNCGTTQCGMFKDSIRIEVLSSGVAPTSISATKPRICMGESTVLSATCTQGTVSWYNDSGLTTSLASSTVSPTQTRYYYVNCGTTQCGMFKDSIRIEVLSSGVAPTSISATKPRICMGESTVLSATCTQGTVSWYNDSGLTTSLASSTVSPTQTRYYYVNCGTTQCGMFKDSIRIEVLSSGVAPTSISATKPRICMGESTVLSATCTQGTVSWYNDSGLTTSLASSTVSPTQTRYYYVNCGTTQCGMFKDSIRIEVLSSGVAPTSISATKPRICMGESTMLSATCTQGTVSWYNDSGLTTSLASSTVSPTQTRYYYVNCGTTQCGMFKDSIRIEVNGCGNNDSIGVLRLKVMLQGALFNQNNPIMRDDLRKAGAIPTKEPYTAIGGRFVHGGGGGGEVLTPFALQDRNNNSVVDWVFIELRSALDKSLVRTVSALVQKDGDIVMPSDGQSPLTFTGALSESYYVCVKHRNHIGVMTAQPLPMTQSGLVFDFTVADSTSLWDNDIIYNGHEQVRILGMEALWAGTTNTDNKVKYVAVANDQLPTFSQVLAYPTNVTFNYNFDAATPVYMNGDVNMDAKVKYSGPVNDSRYVFSNVVSRYARINTGGLSNYDLFLEQIP